MGLEGFPDLTILLDNAASAPKNVSAYVTEINGYSIEQVLEELSSAGDVSDRWGVVGFEQKSEITLSGPYDDVGNGLVDITLDGEGSTRELKLTFDDGATDIRQVDCLIRSTGRVPGRGAFTKYEVVLRPTGAVTG